MRYNITTGDLNNLQQWQVGVNGAWNGLSHPVDYFFVDSNLNGAQSVLMDGVPNYFANAPGFLCVFFFMCYVIAHSCLSLVLDVDIGVGGALKLGVNTAQYGRTFQDRTHKFQILSRSAHNANTNSCIINVLVRGRRGTYSSL